MTRRRTALLLTTAAMLVASVGTAQAESGLTGVTYDAEVTEQAREETPSAVALRLAGSVDVGDFDEATVVGLTLEPEGTACDEDATAAFGDGASSSTQTALEAPGEFSEAVIFEEVEAGSYVMCGYVFQDEGPTLATAQWDVTFGEPRSADDGSASGESGESGEDPFDAPVEIDAGIGTSACLFSRAPVRASRKLTLYCPGVTGAVTVSAFGRGRTRQVTLTLRDGRASVKARRLGLQRKRSVSVRVEQEEEVLLETVLKLRTPKVHRS